MLKKIDWYIIKKFIGTYLLSIVLIISIAVVIDVTEKLDNFFESNATLKAIVFDYYLNFIPYYANIFTPLFTFISVIFFTSKMASNSEIIAILASGIRFRRMLVPYFMSAGLIALVSFVLTGFVSPPANKIRLDFEDKYIAKFTSSVARNVQLEVEKGKPLNPFINAGAIVIADRLMTLLADPDKEFLGFIHELSGTESVDYNLEVAESEREHGYLNAAIANLLKYHGRIENNIEDVLMFYYRMCSVEMNCIELAQAFLAFTNHKAFDFGGYKLSSSKIKRLNAVMQTCGFYDEAGEFSYHVGLPGKSGVGGGIVAVHPLHYSVAVWSPRLNSKGNSVMGMKALELLTTYTEESIF